MINLEEIINGTIIKVCINGHETNCARIGHRNRFGIVKSFCDECYSQVDPKFTKDHWCYDCDKRKDPIDLDDMMYATSMRYSHLYRNRKSFTKNEQGTHGLHTG